MSEARIILQPECNYHIYNHNDVGYLRNLIIYVHQNPVEAAFADKPEHWKYSSYNAIISRHPTLIPREEIIELFGDIENFKYCHLKPVNLEMQ